MNGLKTPKWSLWLYISLSLIGFIDAAYVTVKFYLRGPLNCLIFENCNAVINSSYAKLAGIPISLLGSIFYLTIFLLSVYYVDTKKPAAIKIIFWLTGFGFLFSLYLLFIQAFLLNQFCLYCLISAVISILLFVNTIYNYRKLTRCQYTNAY